MTHQNRVTPRGEIVAHPGRGDFMGNRGILHDDSGQIVRPWRNRAWITCLLSFKDRKPLVPIVQPSNYTRLFFLDEAVAFAAGHRPCAECRREDYNRFRDAWEAAGLGVAPRAKEVDRCLHSARIVPRRQTKITYRAGIETLPDGAFTETEAGPCLILGDRLLPYAPGGYRPAFPRPRDGTVKVLTPAPLVAVLAAGYRPALHQTSGTKRA